MAYADPINPATPSDDDYAGQGDDRDRELKRAIRQRLASFFVDVDADPLTVRLDAITDFSFSDGSFDGIKIAVGSIPFDRVQPDPSGGTAPANSVGTAALQDGSVTEPKLGPSAVTENKIANGAITGPKMATDSVNTGNIVASAITRVKIAPATRGVLTRIAKGTYVYPPGTNLYSAGPDYIGVDIALDDTNGHIGEDAIGLVNPVIGGAIGAGTWSAGFNWECEVLNPTSAQVVLRVRVRNMDNSDSDISGKSFTWAVFCSYEDAEPE